MSSFISDPFGPSTTSSAFQAAASVDSAFVPDIVKATVGNPAFDAAAVMASLKSDTKAISSKGSDERLFTARARYASNDSTNRGTHAYIKLMSSSEQAATYSSKSSTRAVGSSASSSVLSDSLAVMSGSASGQGYDKFLVTNLSASMEEKLQITEVFGDNEVAYYFGKAPMVFAISGMLIDSVDNNWLTDWLYTYDGALRGTQLARNHELLKLVLPSMTLIGSITSFSWEQQSSNETAVPFRFQFLVRSMTPTPAVFGGSAITNAAEQINFDLADTFQAQSIINGLKQQGAMLTSAIQNAGSIGGLGSALSKYGSSLSGYMGIGGTPSSVSGAIDSLSNMITGSKSSFSNLISPITSSLSGIRATLFSPVYGVMSSLTKLVKNVFGIGGFGSILASLTAPIKGILGDIARIATQASAIVGMVTGGISNLTRGIASGFGIVQSFETAVKSFKHAAGTIAAAPTSISKSIKLLVNSGGMHTSSSFLNPNPKFSLSKSASLSSNSSTPGSGSSLLGSGHGAISSQLAILGSGTKTVASTGAYL